MKTFDYTIKNPEGVHARPAGALIKECSTFQCQIELSAKGQTISVKSGIFALMSLGLRYGDTVSLKFNGSDEEQALEKISALISEIL